MLWLQMFCSILEKKHSTDANELGENTAIAKLKVYSTYKHKFN